MSPMRSLAATLVLCSLVLPAAASAAATAPPPPPKFWTINRCERAVHAHNYDSQLTVEGHAFYTRIAVCVGAGGPQACTWTSDHRARLYSEFTVLGAPSPGGIVRSYTIATRARHGFIRVGIGLFYHHGWPADCSRSNPSTAWSC